MRLTIKQLQLLDDIAKSQHECVLQCAGQLANVHGFSEFTVLEACKRLERRGLIEAVDMGKIAARSTWGTKWRLTDAGVLAR